MKLDWRLLLQMLAFVSILATGNAMWKYGLMRMGGFLTTGDSLVKSVWALFLNPWIWAGGVFYVLGTLVWFFILSRQNLSAVAPMLSMGYILTGIVGIVFFHESVSLTGWIGMAMVLAGFIVLSLR